MAGFYFVLFSAYECSTGRNEIPVLRRVLAGNGELGMGGAATEDCGEDRSSCESALFRVLFIDVAQRSACARAFHV